MNQKFCGFVIGHNWKVLNGFLVIADGFKGDLKVECKRCGRTDRFNEGSTLWKEWARANKAPKHIYIGGWT